jgi:hypothetical protein
MYEPMKKERFLITLPESFTIRGWWVTLSSTTTGRLFNSDMVKSELVNGYTEVKIKFYETISSKMAYQLGNMSRDNKLFDFTIESIDPTGVTTNKWLIVDASIKEVRSDNIDENGLVDIEISIIPNGFTLLK